MKKRAMLLAAVLCVAVAPAFGGDDRNMPVKAMDTNGDGMLTRDEFMRFHESLWGQMKKNSSGMVDMRDMGMGMGMGMPMCMGMGMGPGMGHGMMMNESMYEKMHERMHEKMTKDGKAAKDKAK